MMTERRLIILLFDQKFILNYKISYLYYVINWYQFLESLTFKVVFECNLLHCFLLKIIWICFKKDIFNNILNYKYNDLLSFWGRQSHKEKVMDSIKQNLIFLKISQEKIESTIFGLLQVWEIWLNRYYVGWIVWKLF